MKRPLGITILSLLLAWLAVAGFGNAVIWNLSTVQELMQKLPPSERMPIVGGPAFTAIALVYGVTAALASVTLWRMHPAASLAYGAWCIAVLLSGLWMVFAGFESDIALGLAFAFGAAALLALGIPYVKAKLRSARPNNSLEQTRES